MKNRKYPLYDVELSNTINEFARKCNEKYSENLVFEYKIKNKAYSVTYNEFYENLIKLCACLIARGYNGSHMALLGENCYEWIVTYFGVACSSNVIVPIDKELSVDEIIGLIEHSDSEVLFYSKKYKKYIERIIKKLPQILLVCINEESNALENEVTSLHSLISEGEQREGISNNPYDTININPEQLAAIHYTSGTTGVSKGVMLSHRGILSSGLYSVKNVKLLGKSVLVLPLFHTYGFTVGVVGLMATGNTIFINENLKKISKDLKEQKPDHMILVPMFLEKMYENIWKSAKKSRKTSDLKKLIKVSNILMKVGIDLRRRLFKSVLDGFGGRLEYIISGGAPLDTNLVKKYREIGINVYNGYGITECSPVVSANRNNHYKDGSVGIVLGCCEVDIDEPDIDGEGEVLVKGQNVMLGYYKNQEATQQTFKGEWFKTGDYGRLDQDNFLYITGRKKNLIVLNNGKNIYPEELEILIHNIPYVKEVIIYSENKSTSNELEIVAEVFFDDEYIQSEQIEDKRLLLEEDIKQINGTIPSYKNITKIKIRDTEFEKTSTHKIKRRVAK